MFDVLPLSFFAARRGICPTCGAALELAGGSVQRCAYCSGRSVLERRLVDLGSEPDYGLGDDDRRGEADDARWLREEFAAIDHAPVRCPGCGSDLPVGDDERTTRCTHCGTTSRVERRLRALGPGTLGPPQRRTYQDFLRQRYGQSRLRWDVETEQLCWRILHEPDSDRRAALARTLGDSWGYVNATLVYFLPWLLGRAARERGVLADWTVQAVGKLLCHEDRALWRPTLEACSQFAFDVNGPPSLLHELGLGKAVCVRLLLDVAEYAWSRGARLHAAHAAWAVTTLIDRNFDDHPFIAEVMLHRLYYLSGPVLGWALDKIASGMGGYLFRDAARLLRAIDDLAVERPAVASAMAAPIRFLAPQTDGAYLERLALVGTLRTAAARRAALSHLIPPQAMAASTSASALVLLGPLADDPFVGDLARAALAAVRGGDWQPPPESPPPPEVAAARADWDAAIREAVARREARRESLRPEAERARALDVPIYDGPRDEPPTEAIETPPPEPDGADEPDVDPDPAPEVAPPDVAAALARYLETIAALQAELVRVATAGGDTTGIVARMQQAVEEYARSCQSGL